MLEPVEGGHHVIAGYPLNGGEKSEEPLFGNSRRDLGGDAAGLRSLGHDDAAPGPRHGREDRVEVKRLQRRNVDDLRGDALGGELVRRSILALEEAGEEARRVPLYARAGAALPRLTGTRLGLR